MPLQLREYQKNDFIALKNIIRKTWRYDEFSSPKTASRLADVFLSSCLTNYTFSRVAVLNGKPVGIILVKDIARHTCPLPNRFRQLRAVLSLYLTKEGRAVSKIFENVTGIDRELLRESGKNYPAELALFMVSPSCRGQGVGKALFQAALDYTGQQKLDEIYLFTDTSCNTRACGAAAKRSICSISTGKPLPRAFLFTTANEQKACTAKVPPCKQTRRAFKQSAPDAAGIVQPGARSVFCRFAVAFMPASAAAPSQQPVKAATASRKKAAQPGVSAS